MSDNLTNPALEQLLKLTTATVDPSILSRFQGFIQKGGTVYELLEMGPHVIVETFDIHLRDAHALLESATSLAVYTAREYREQQLLRQGPPNPLHHSGIRTVGDTPTLDGLFDTDWENCTPPQSPDANNGACAYLVKLCELALDLEGRAGGETLTIRSRRPDIGTLQLDATSLYQLKSTVSLVNGVMEDIIKASVTLQSDHVVDDLMLQTRFPFRSMPFEWYHEQWSQVLQHNNILLGEVVRAIDKSAPYFKQKGAHGTSSDVALRQSSCVGPVGQLLLTESYKFPLTSQTESDETLTGTPAAQWVAPVPSFEQFISDNFGTTPDALLDSVHFCTKASINAQDLTEFLSIEDHATGCSKNQTIVPVDAFGPEKFGSVFINDGKSPALGLSDASKGLTRQLINTNQNRFERINRMLRLARWLKLPFQACDRLVVAAIRAEQRRNLQSTSSADPAPLRITNNTLRALGLFQEFRQAFNCSAEECAALFDEISLFFTGKEDSQFDRIFNNKAYFDAPLILDNGQFSINAQTRADKRTVDHICCALGLNEEEWRYLARVVAKSHNLTTHLERSLPILSSLYRLVRLSSLLKVTPIEMGALLETFSERGAGVLLQKITGESRISVSGVTSDGDILSVMRAAADCVQWCRENDLSVSWVVQKVAPVIVPQLPTAADTSLLETLHQRSQPVLFTEAKLLEAGVPVSRNIDYAGWLDLLKVVVDSHGLVRALAVNDGEAYERLARAEIQVAAREEKLEPDEAERVVSIILAMLLQIKASQSAVVQESLSGYLDLNPDLTLPLLKWVSQGGVSLLLTEAARALSAVTSGADKIRVGDEVLSLLAHLLRRAAVVQKLGLSSAMLVTLTTRENWKWFGLLQAKDLTLHTMYKLTLYRRAVIHTEQPAEKLLDYLQLVNSLPECLTDEDFRLIRDSAASQLAQVLKWGVREVLDCILHLLPDSPIVKGFDVLDTLLRIRGLAVRSGLAAKAIIELGKLTPDSDKYACRSAAEHLLESLSESSIQGDDQSFGELGQSSTAEINCLGTPLIANAGEEQVALIELKVRDLDDKPYVGITVRWSCDRPGLLDDESFTDQDGRAVARFKAGSWMGIAHVKAVYGLQQVAVAEVVIDCDERTLGFALDSLRFESREYLAGGQDFIPLEVQLVDFHENPGIGRTMEFAGHGIRADYLSAVTDENGFARTNLRSMEPVTNATVLVRYSTLSPKLIGNITFLDRPSVRLLAAESMAVVGTDLVLRCHVIKLDRTAAPDVDVMLKYDGKTLGPIKTDGYGVARFTIPSPDAGMQTFTAVVGSSEQSLKLYVAEGAVIHGHASDYPYPVADKGSSTLLWVKVLEKADNQARPVPNCSITWVVDALDVPPPEVFLSSIVLTDEQGRSAYPFEALEPGKYRVTAYRTDIAEQKVVFSLEVVPAIDWSFEWVDVTPESKPVTEAPLLFIRGHEYRLVIKLPEGVDLQNARAMLSWTGDFSAKALGLNFTPLTGAYVLIRPEDKKLSWVVRCDDDRNGSFNLTFFCNRLNQRLELPGRLDAPPPVLTYPENGDQTVEVQPLLKGTGSAFAEISVLEGRDSQTRLAQTSVNAQGRWSVRFPEPLTLDSHVFSVMQRHVDGSEGWAPDVNVKVTDFIDRAQITSPAMHAKVGPSSWVEGLGLPGADIRLLKNESNEEIGKGIVAKDGHFRVQFAPPLTVGSLTFQAAFYVDGEKKSDLLLEPYVVDVVDRG
ncbi:Tc toxin subunit A [Pseudomonas migulae]|uniref:Virulence plasmid A protein n=1 Tax=Pseudomonas migulae TaxID=78543 RepID=A0A1H5MJV3_9PSED|nr:Tc toxin subunit A [Pseudomonas migulae]SEE89604.1 virulence plasmid A protein [Pseudomonas migulae]